MKTIQALSLCIIFIFMAAKMQASESSRRITIDESRNAELQYDLGSEYYLAEKNNLRRLAISLQQNSMQNFQDLSPEEIIACQKRTKKAILLSKMSPEDKVAWTAQKIRYKLLSKKSKKRNFAQHEVLANTKN